MTDLQRLQIAFDLLWTQFVGVSKQLEAEREKNAKLVAQMGVTAQGGGASEVVSISR